MKNTFADQVTYIKAEKRFKINKEIIENSDASEPEVAHGDLVKITRRR
jgi:hypothetical protein